MEHITEDYCDKELTGLLIGNGYIGHRNIYLDKDGFKSERISLQSAMKWLREIHNLHIIIECGYGNRLMYFSNIKNTLTNDSLPNDTGYYNTYEEACEAGIRYGLENLI